MEMEQVGLCENDKCYLFHFGILGGESIYGAKFPGMR